MRESTIVAGWLTSGLEIAMYRMGWNLLSTRKELTKLNKEALYHRFHHGYPHCHEDHRPYQKYGNHWFTEEEWEQLCWWLTGDPTFRSKVERHRKELLKKITGKRDESPSRHKARRIALVAQAAHPRPWPLFSFDKRANLVYVCAIVRLKPSE